MAAGIVYLDVDDEITSAASRIRTAPGTKVALVVPYGSRIATSRMNFRLLSREAIVSNRRLWIVSGDAASRALAASAGLPVFATVSEYESALESGGLSSDAGGDTGPAGPATSLADSETVAAVGPPAAANGAVPVAPPDDGVSTPSTSVRSKKGAGRDSAAPVVTDETAATSAVQPAPVAVISGSPPAADLRPAPELPFDRTGGTAARRPGPVASAGGRARVPVIAAVAVAALAVIVLAVGAYLFLPSASIAVTPRREPIGPIPLTVSADPDATAVDAANSTVPALRVPVPVQVSQTFTTTGKKVTETKASGSVTFENNNTGGGYSIPAGSVVSTEGGIRFRTLASVSLPPAAFNPSFQPSRRTVAIAAVRSGIDGNVPATAIHVFPQSPDPTLVQVSNRNPTTDGTHTETPQVEQGEVDQAVATLTAQLHVAFDDAIKAGAGAPADTTLFPTTASLGPVTPSVDPRTLVGQAVATFDLGMSANGTVIAVDPRPIRTIAETQLRNEVGADHRLVDGSIQVDVGEGTVGEDGQVSFEATARATRILVLDPAILRGLVKGKTEADAEAALAPFGQATVTLWPAWVKTVTGFDTRLSLTVDDGGASPKGSPAPSGSPAPTRSGSLGTSSPRASSAAPGGSSVGSGTP